MHTCRNPEEWVHPRDEKCRIVFGQESGSFPGFLPALRTAVFDCVGIVMARGFLQPCSSGAVAKPLACFLQKKIKNCQFWESLVGVMDSFEDVILYRIGIDGVIHYITPNVERYGFVAKEVIGLPLMRFVHPEDLSLVAQSFADIEALQKNPVRFRVLGPQGQTFYVRTSSRFVAGSRKAFGTSGNHARGNRANAGIPATGAGAPHCIGDASSVRRAVRRGVAGRSVLVRLPDTGRGRIRHHGASAECRSPRLRHGHVARSPGKDFRGFLFRAFLEFLAQRPFRNRKQSVYQHDPDFKRFLIQSELAGVGKHSGNAAWLFRLRFSGKLFLSLKARMPSICRPWNYAAGGDAAYAP
jgi:hypothetical protein